MKKFNFNLITLFNVLTFINSGVSNTPETYVVLKDGVTKEELEQSIEELWNEKKNNSLDILDLGKFLVIAITYIANQRR